MKIVKGNLLDLAENGEFDLIIQGCNCWNTMSSGIAKQIHERYPEVYNVDAKTRKGDITKLGNYTFKAPIGFGDSFIVINAYTQYNYGKDSIKADYEAIALVMRKINHNFRGQRIGLPKIGAGLAGGDWNRIIKIIETELVDCDVTIVEYNNK